MRKFIKGFYFAWNGIKYAFKTQVNFKFHVLAAAIVINLGWYSDLNTTEWLWISAAIALVLVTELINTAIELLVDLISPGFDHRAGAIKDVAAGAVLVASFVSLMIGLLIFIPKVL